jgi:hypothetical protein
MRNHFHIHTKQLINYYLVDLEADGMITCEILGSHSAQHEDDDNLVTE